MTKLDAGICGGETLCYLLIGLFVTFENIPLSGIEKSDV